MSKNNIVDSEVDTTILKDVSSFKTMKKEDLARFVLGIQTLKKNITQYETEARDLLKGQIDGNGETIGNVNVTIVTMPNYRSVSLDEARQYGAVIEAVDTDAIKKLVKNGIEVKGVTHTQSMRITEVKSKK